MELTLGSRIKNAWNTFLNRDPTTMYRESGYVSYYRPDRPRLSGRNERSIVTSVLNRIALDVASVEIKHCRTDKDGRFVEELETGLNNCLTLEANIDQTHRSFIQDAVLTMLDEGCVALVPVDTTIDPDRSSSYDIITMRTGKVVQWYPTQVKVDVYNDRTGKHENIILNKRNVGIVTNPFYEVMNEPNSTLKRLIRKLVLLDSIDEQSGAGKLDLIIQLPYVVKSDARKKQANQRREEIENQLANSKYGIAYTDGTEKVTQLNRPVENNLMKQVEYLTNLLFSQLNITQEILNGTANEATMLNYMSRTVEPLVAAITDEIKRKFLTKTARSQKQTIMFFRDPFKLVPVKDLAELADKFTRNEIASSNEIRQIVGWKPSDDPRADQLINSNLNHSPDEMGGMPTGGTTETNTTLGNQPTGDNTEDDKTVDEEIDEETIEEVLNTLNEEQKEVVRYLLQTQ